MPTTTPQLDHSMSNAYRLTTSIESTQTQRQTLDVVRSHENTSTITRPWEDYQLSYMEAGENPQVGNAAVHGWDRGLWWLW